MDESIAQHTAGFLSKINDLLIVIAAVFVLHLTGLWDDRKHLGPLTKLVIQFAVAIVAVVFADIRVEMFIDNPIIPAHCRFSGLC